MSAACPGGRAPRAIPRPLTGAGGGAGSPLLGVDGSGSRFASGSAIASGSASDGCGRAASRGRLSRALLCSRAPGAPRDAPCPLTGAAGAPVAAGAARCIGRGGSPRPPRELRSLASAAGAAFLAPGRLAPPAIPRPLTGAAGAAALRRSFGLGLGRPVRLLGAGRLAPPEIPRPLTGAAGAAFSGLGGRGLLRVVLRPVPREPQCGALGAAALGLACSTLAARCSDSFAGRALLRQRRLVVLEGREQDLGDVEHLDAAAAGLFLPVVDAVGLTITRQNGHATAMVEALVAKCSRRRVRG